MSTVTENPIVLFPDGYHGRREVEKPAKGWLDGVIVQLEDGSRYRLFFYDPCRLQQDLEAYAQKGNPYLAEPNLVVLPEVNTEAINQAVRALIQDGYFKHLKPL